jgi:hypothetical protein
LPDPTGPPIPTRAAGEATADAVLLSSITCRIGHLSM